MKLKHRSPSRLVAVHWDSSCLCLSFVALALALGFLSVALRTPSTRISCFHHDPLAGQPANKQEDIDCLFSVKRPAPWVLPSFVSSLLVAAPSDAVAPLTAQQHQRVFTLEVKSASVVELCREPPPPVTDGGKKRALVDGASSLRHHDHHVHPNQCLSRLLFEDEQGLRHPVHDFTSRREAHRALNRIRQFISRVACLRTD